MSVVKKLKDQFSYNVAVVSLVCCLLILVISGTRHNHREPQPPSYEEEFEKLHQDRIQDFMELEQIRDVTDKEELHQMGVKISEKRIAEMNALRRKHGRPLFPPNPDR